jgi:hypothetical protein
VNEIPEGRVSAVAGVAVVAATAMTTSITITQRGYFSTHHLWSARHFTALAADQEAAQDRTPRFSVRHRSYVISAITESVAFMEAAINEVFQDAADGRQSYIHPLAPAVRATLGTFWMATDDGKKYVPVQEKYNLALCMAGKPFIDRGQNPYTDAKILINLRNWLIHFRPEDFSSETEHKLGGWLKERNFPPNALMVGAGNSYFPDHALGAGCAHWAHTAAVNFVDRFASVLGLTLNYQIANFDSEVPEFID